MKQVWQPLTIKCDSNEVAKQREVSLSRCDKCKDVKRSGNVVTYKQLTWECNNEQDDN